MLRRMLTLVLAGAVVLGGTALPVGANETDPSGDETALVSFQKGKKGKKGKGKKGKKGKKGGKKKGGKKKGGEV